MVHACFCCQPARENCNICITYVRRIIHVCDINPNCRFECFQFYVGSSLCVHYKRLCLLWKRKIFVEILIANCIYPQFQKPNFVSREFFPKRADENGVTNGGRDKFTTDNDCLQSDALSTSTLSFIIKDFYSITCLCAYTYLILLLNI